MDFLPFCDIFFYVWFSLPVKCTFALLLFTTCSFPLLFFFCGILALSYIFVSTVSDSVHFPFLPLVLPSRPPSLFFLLHCVALLMEGCGRVSDASNAFFIGLIVAACDACDCGLLRFALVSNASLYSCFSPSFRVGRSPLFLEHLSKKRGKLPFYATFPFLWECHVLPFLFLFQMCD